MDIDYIEYAKILKVFSDPKRLKIVHMLSLGEMCACKIQEQFNITQPTLSHDMKLLNDAGVVFTRKDGKWTYYSLNDDRINELYQIFGRIVERKTVADNLGACGEA